MLRNDKPQTFYFYSFTWRKILVSISAFPLNNINFFFFHLQFIPTFFHLLFMKTQALLEKVINEHELADNEITEWSYRWFILYFRRQVSYSFLNVHEYTFNETKSSASKTNNKPIIIVIMPTSS